MKNPRGCDVSVEEGGVWNNDHFGAHYTEPSVRRVRLRIKGAMRRDMKREDSDKEAFTPFQVRL